MRIELVGELDVATAPELRSRVDEITSADGDAWIDCTELTFADSSGIVLTNVRPMVRRAMDVLQITELFDLEEAP